MFKMSEGPREENYWTLFKSKGVFWYKILGQSVMGMYEAHFSKSDPWKEAREMTCFGVLEQQLSFKVTTDSVRCLVLFN